MKDKKALTMMLTQAPATADSLTGKRGSVTLVTALVLFFNKNTVFSISSL